MLRITVTHHLDSRTVEIPAAFAPALRSAITEMRNELGERLAGMHKYEKEDALTRAVAALGQLAATINAVVLEDDPDYD